MAKLIPKKIHKYFWSEEKGLTSIFILLCISNFLVIPFFGKQQTIQFLIRIIWFGLLVAGISSLSESRSQMRNFAIIPALLVADVILNAIMSSRFLNYVDLFVQVAVFGLLIGMVLIKVFEKGPVTIHRVIGSIVVYMLIGDIWAGIYQFLYINLPGSLQVPEIYSATGVPSSVFLYFSFTTLTTTGYGEILPLHSLARTMVIIEQLIGVLYPVVLIGRLVGMVVGGTSADSATNEQPPA